MFPATKSDSTNGARRTDAVTIQHPAVDPRSNVQRGNRFRTEIKRPQFFRSQTPAGQKKPGTNWKETSADFRKAPKPLFWSTLMTPY